MPRHRCCHGTSTLNAYKRNIAILSRLGLAGVITLAGACNRVEPTKSDDKEGSSAQAAAATGEADVAKLTQQTGTDAQRLLSPAQGNSSEPAGVFPPGAQPVSTQGGDQPGSSGGAATGEVTTTSGSGTGGSLTRGSDAVAPSNQASNPSGVHIEMTTPSLPKGGADATSPANSEAISQSNAEREFMKLKLPDSNRAEDLLRFFGQCDKAIQELTIAAHTQQMGEAEFHEHAKRLSQMKYEAAERMLALSDLTPDQQRSATSARVESLSHLTSLGDVPAAQKLQALAQELSKSSDRELAHQGRLVLLGFRLNELLEGQVKDPQTLLADAGQLLQTPEDHGLVELMALQRCADVLSQLGYSDESKQVIDFMVKEYRNSPDPELSMRAWALETNGAPATVAFNQAVEATLNGTEKDPMQIARASADLLRAFPSVNTLWHVTRLTIPLEFSGNVAAASEVAKVATELRSQLPSSPLSPEIDSLLDCHTRRLSLRGQALGLRELASFDGKPFDWSSYRGKVVLICFWASWELNSLTEIQRLTRLRQEIPSKEFEIVTINLDSTNMNSAEQMVSRHNYPWVSLRSSNPNLTGFDSTAAKDLGVNAVPFVLLVDREGRVAAIHARGDKTATMINELLAKP